MDPILISIDNALRTLFAKPLQSRALGYQASGETGSKSTTELTTEERGLSGALMRVNHVGEVCAQALYASQGLATKNADLKLTFRVASHEEFDHLAWTEARLGELKAHKSYLNPLWYAGSFAIGYVAGRIGGDKVSLGFVVETERQVTEHLKSHLARLPKTDKTSRAIVKQMIIDEEAHAKLAQTKGAVELPSPLKFIMRSVAKVMTTTAYYV